MEHKTRDLKQAEEKKKPNEIGVVQGNDELTTVE